MLLLSLEMQTQQSDTQFGHNLTDILDLTTLIKLLAAIYFAKVAIWKPSDPKVAIRVAQNKNSALSLNYLGEIASGFIPLQRVGNMTS